MSYKFIKKNIKSYGGFYYPPNELRKDLYKVLIFTEGTLKGNIPNGSLFIYTSKEYIPDILKDDVGCGITGFVTEGIDFTKKTIDDIVKAVNELNINIGQGNHFIDFTTAHPFIRDSDKKSNMIFIHSDFNNKIPTSYEEAKDIEKKSKEKRIEYVENLTKLLKLKSKYYNNWTHNSVSLENDLMIYRKGAINLKESKNIGALALNPLDGIFLYFAKFEEFFNSMQHGLGTYRQKENLYNFLKKTKKGIAIGYDLNNIKRLDYEKLKMIKNKSYKKLDDFLNNFWQSHTPIGICSPKLIIRTKNLKNSLI